MQQFSGIRVAALSIEVINLLIFLTVGVILSFRVYKMKVPKSRRFIYFSFVWAASQLVDLSFWVLEAHGILTKQQMAFSLVDSLLCYGSYFLFLNMLLVILDLSKKDNVWMYTLYLGLFVVMGAQIASIVVKDPEIESIMNGIYLALSAVVLMAELILVLTNTKKIMKLETVSLVAYTLGELVANMLIRDPDLRFAVLSSVGAIFAMMIYGVIMQRLILLNTRENKQALQRASSEREKVEETVKQMSQTLDKYVGHDVAELLLNEQILHGQSRQVVIFFADIEGFTSLCESFSPQEVMSILNLFLETMANAVLENEGTIDKFIGDCTMALWNAALDQPDGAYQACRAALVIKNGVKVVNQIIEREYGLHLEVNTGIAVGPAVIGNFGSATRKSFTAVGDTVNVAARIQDLADHGVIYVTRDIMESVGDRGVFEKRNSIILKGKTVETEVYELISLAE